MKYFAHSGHDKEYRDWQLMTKHLVNVSRIAESMIRTALGDDDLAASCSVAGLLHDLGKYRPEFQQMLLGLKPPRNKTFHKQAGAAKAEMLRNLPVAFAIAGHHGGIPNKTDLESAILSDNGLAVVEQVWEVACEDLPELKTLAQPKWMPKNELQFDLITRTIFSCLVDADWSDTSNHERIASGFDPEPEPAEFRAQIWLGNLLAVLAEKSKTCREEHIQTARTDVLNSALLAAESPQGVFSLTVPTGGGKTLSGLAFALKHAIKHGLRRVIYVAPYLTILEQNEDAIRTALGFEHNSPELFAHHSLAEPPGAGDDESSERDAAARRAENWDAPIIITTSVQFFESLFSNKPGRCRKLHNIARSVVILDECQTLPPKLVAPTCGMLKQLVDELKASIVLCTATQPAFDHAELKSDERLSTQEIAPVSLHLFDRLKRVHIHWPQSREEAIDWTELAAQMMQRENRSTPNDSVQSLCVVNSRRAAREIFEELRKETPEGVFHLSTSMCPAHRLAVFKDVRLRLKENRQCLLVSTQLIEAGVDVDFPRVFRELGPLESIIQAAGRCNREGALRDTNGLTTGKVIVFRSQRSLDEPRKYFPPDEWYKAGKSTLENHFLNAGKQPQIDRPEEIREYFTRLYHSGSLDQHHIQDARRNLKFADVAESYQLIDQDGIAAIIATWEPHRQQVERLLKKLRRDSSRANFRKLAPYQVNLRYYELRTVGDSVVPVSEQIDTPVWYGRYDDHLGINTDATDALLMV
jgi:CRISPR-associated endonuclease/helicase Cas3